MKSSSTVMRSALSALVTALACAASAQQLPAQEDFNESHAAQQREHMRHQERQSLAQQRSALQAEQAKAEKACMQRFAVEDCLRNVRSDMRAKEEPLKNRELAINQQERQEKTAARLQSIEQKKLEKRVPPALSITARKQGQSAIAPVERESQAQARAAAQAQRLAQHQQKVAERERAQEAQRQQAVRDLQIKQQQAQAYRERKMREMEKRQGAALPIPTEIPSGSAARQQ